ncbi:MAG: hypothetical protein ACD_75C01170G0002 [uncultured bacterium]|nr:MAG: hypothetical protein ACD_75C01170G0002 [uncultured bacterium]
MNNMKLLAVMVAVLLFSSTSAVISAQEKPEEWGAEQGQDIPILDKEQEKSLDKAQEEASETLLDAARWIDSFFEDNRLLAEENTTRGTVKLSLGYSKNDQFEIKPRFDLRLKLPRLSDQVNLFFEAADDEDFNIDSDPLGDRKANNDGTDNELTGGLRYFLKESKKININFDTGASWNYLFAGVRFRSVQDFGKWDGRFTNRLRYYTDDGLENKASYDLERQVGENWLFRTTTSVNLFENESGIPHSQYFRLYHVLSSHQAISYESGVYFNTEPSYKLTDTHLLIRYRQRFFRDWLVLEISPRITFPEDHDREANPGIVIKFEAAIGYQADEEGYRKVFR